MATSQLPSSSYKGGPYLDGLKKLSSEDINSNTIILADKEKEYHKAGRNAIRLDGSFTQAGSAGNLVQTPPPPEPFTEEEIAAATTALTNAISAINSDNVLAALAAGADINARHSNGTWIRGYTIIEQFRSSSFTEDEIDEFTIIISAIYSRPELEITTPGPRNNGFATIIAYVDWIGSSTPWQEQFCRDMEALIRGLTGNPE